MQTRLYGDINVKSLVSVALCFLFLTSCTTTSSLHNAAKFKDLNKTVYVSEHLNGWEQRHIYSVLKVLERYGFNPSKDREHSDLQLDFAIEGGVLVTARIALLHKQETLLVAESSNFAWGTVLFRPIAIAGRVQAALEDFEAKLKETQAFN